MSKINHLKVIAFATIITASTLVVVFIFIIVAYIFMSYWQKDDPPADYDISVPKQIYPGAVMPFDVININRHKVCPYRRIINIVDSQGNTYNNQELSGYPAATLGKNSDIHLSFITDKRIATGPAQFNVVIEYSCPGNFFHAVLNEPFVRRHSFPLNVLQEEP